MPDNSELDGFEGVLKGCFGSGFAFGLMSCILLALPVTCMVIGGMHMYDCPREHLIPVYLLVMGLFSSITLLLHAFRRWCTEEDGVVSNVFKYIAGFITFFLIAWFVAGCVFTYHIHNDYQSDDPSGQKFCHIRVYLFSFWFQNASFIISGILLIAYFNKRSLEWCRNEGYIKI